MSPPAHRGPLSSYLVMGAQKGGNRDTDLHFWGTCQRRGGEELKTGQWRLRRPPMRSTDVHLPTPHAIIGNNSERCSYNRGRSGENSVLKKRSPVSTGAAPLASWTGQPAGRSCPKTPPGRTLQAVCRRVIRAPASHQGHRGLPGMAQGWHPVPFVLRSST